MNRKLNYDDTGEVFNWSGTFFPACSSVKSSIKNKTAIAEPSILSFEDLVKAARSLEQNKKEFNALH